MSQLLSQLLGRVLFLYRLLERASALPALIVRAGVGLMFLGGAIHKATHLSEFVAYFAQLHIPAPQLQAPFVVAVEFFGGLLLMLGLGTRPAALLLSGTMVVALATAAIPDHKIHASWRGLLDFLYLPEWLLLCLLGWLIFVGAGRLSLDHGLRKRVIKYLGSVQE
jgi:putative oxidoreductase